MIERRPLTDEERQKYQLSSVAYRAVCIEYAALSPDERQSYTVDSICDYCDTIGPIYPASGACVGCKPAFDRMMNRVKYVEKE